MINKWKKFLFEQENRLNFSQIERIYDKSKIAIELVNLYNSNLLKNISTIANLQSNVYGIYNSAENKKILPPEIEQRLLYFGNINKNNISTIPEKTIRQYFPDIPQNAITPSDTIHVNVQKIINEKKTDLEKVFSIAMTIVHETQHENDHEVLGYANELSAKNAEDKFAQWFNSNINMILQKFPELNY